MKIFFATLAPAFVFVFTFALALPARSAVFLYDGIPAEGVGAYAAGNISGKGSTHSSIVGESGNWDTSSSGVMTVQPESLGYPAAVQLATQPGAILVPGQAASGGTAGERRGCRAIVSPNVGGKSFYFSVLIGFNSLSQMVAGGRQTWCLSQSAPASGLYNANAKSFEVGFVYSASSGVNAILRVANANTVMASDLAPGTYLFAGKVEYDASGAETVSASLNPLPFESGTWDAAASANILATGERFSHVVLNVDYKIGVGNSVWFDEWRVGDTYADVMGTAVSQLPAIATFEPTAIDLSSAMLNGMLVSTGMSETVVWVYYGSSNALETASGWEFSHPFGAAAQDSAPYSFAASGLAPFTKYYCRFYAENSGGGTWAPQTKSFVTQPCGIPGVTNLAASAIGQKTATISGNVATSSPPAVVWLALDLVDHGADSALGDWARVENIGAFTLPSAFSKTCSDLLANGAYVARVFATNELGGAWSEPLLFKTAAPLAKIGDVNVDEGGLGADGAAVFTVTLDAASAIPVSVGFATADISATAGEDYAPTNGVLAFAPGVVSASISVRIIGDAENEFPGESFWLDLSAPSNCVLPAAVHNGKAPFRNAECYVWDDDMYARLFFDNFNDGNYNGWTPLDGTKWKVENNRLCAVGSDTSDVNLIYLNQAPWSDVSFRWKGGWDSSWRKMHFRFGMDSSNAGGYDFNISGRELTGANAWMGSESITLTKIGVATPLATVGETARYNNRLGSSYANAGAILRPLAVRLSKHRDGGLRIQCFVGFVKVIDVVDNANPVFSGRVGFVSGEWTPPYIDDFEIWRNPFPSASVIIIR